jgi:DNA polymerase-1
MAHFSKDKTLVAAFRNGEDIHRRTASEIMDCSLDLVSDDMRRAAKSINFGLIYGMGEFRLAQELGATRKKAGEYIKAYFEKMPDVLKFRDDVIEKARKEEEVRTMFGHRRRLPEINSKNRNLQAQGERLAVNTLIQGTAAEVIKLAMIELDRALTVSGLDAVLLLQVHDELVLECPVNQLEKVGVLLKETMERVVAFEVPITVDVHSGKNWKEAK